MSSQNLSSPQLPTMSDNIPTQHELVSAEWPQESETQELPDYDDSENYHRVGGFYFRRSSVDTSSPLPSPVRRRVWEAALDQQQLNLTLRQNRLETQHNTFETALETVEDRQDLMSDRQDVDASRITRIARDLESIQETLQSRPCAASCGLKSPSGHTKKHWLPRCFKAEGAIAHMACPATAKGATAESDDEVFEGSSGGAGGKRKKGDEDDEVEDEQKSPKRLKISSEVGNNKIGDSEVSEGPRPPVASNGLHAPGSPGYFSTGSTSKKRARSSRSAERLEDDEEDKHKAKSRKLTTQNEGADEEDDEEEDEEEEADEESKERLKIKLQEKTKVSAEPKKKAIPKAKKPTPPKKTVPTPTKARANPVAKPDRSTSTRYGLRNLVKIQEERIEEERKKKLAAEEKKRADIKKKAEAKKKAEMKKQAEEEEEEEEEEE